jgi:hypothetical protein
MEITGVIAGRREGALYLDELGRGNGPPAAQFTIPGLQSALDGLWVRRCGRSIWTRVKAPRGYTELMLPDTAFMGKFRVAIASPGAEEATRRRLDSDFTAWHLRAGVQGTSLSHAGSFEISSGILFTRGAGNEFSRADRLDAFAAAVAALADRVAAFADRAPA